MSSAHGARLWLEGYFEKMDISQQPEDYGLDMFVSEEALSYSGCRCD